MEHSNIPVSPPNGSAPKKFSAVTVVGIIGLIILIHFGFYHSYIKHFPQFKSVTVPLFGKIDFTWIMHVHGMVMMGWVLLLLIQPILIRQGKTELHKRIGKLSYLWAPMVVISIFLANKSGYHRTVQSVGENQAVAMLSLTFPGLIFFAALYTLAMMYKKRTDLHMRFMISTAFLLIPPALDRTLGYFFNLPGYDVGNYIQLSIIALVVLYDSIKLKKPSPFLLVFAFELLHKTFWHLKETESWQVMGRAIAKLF